MIDFDNIDITADIADGSEGALGDHNVSQNAQSDDSTMATPPGTQPVHGDAKHVNAVDPVTNKEPSLRDQLSNAFKGKEGEPVTQENAQSVTPPIALTKDDAGKYRAPDGTFASAEQIAAFEAASTPPVSREQSPVIAGLTPAEQQQFQSLPAELRQYVERTMEDLNTRGTRYGEYDQIEQNILGPRRAAFAQQGMNPLVALNQLFTLSDFAGTDPSNFVLWFAQQRNLDLDALLDARDAAANANPVDPVVQQLQGQVSQLTNQVQQFQQAGTQQTQEQNLSVVTSFAEEKGQDGSLKRPYITDVLDNWATQITAVQAANPTMPKAEVLQKAYDNACWSDPTVRAKMQAAANVGVQQQNAARVAAARTAGSSVTGAPAGDVSTTPNNSDSSIRESLESAFAAARAV